MNNNHVFITGAAGFVGKHLVCELSSRGYYVKALVRKRSDISAVSSKIRYIVGDIRNPRTFASEIHGIDVIYHLAGVVTDWAPVEIFESVHVQGTYDVLMAAVKARVRLFVHMSTLDVLAKTKLVGQNFLIREGSQYSSSTAPYIKTKVAAEKMVFEVSKKTGMNIVIARPAWIYGPGDRTFFPEVAYQISKKSMVYIGNSQNLVQLVYIENLIKSLIYLSEHPEIWGRALAFYDREPITIKELCDFVADGLGLTRVSTTIPYLPAYMFSAIFEFFGHLFHSNRRPILTRTSVEMMGQNVSFETKETDALKLDIPHISTKEGVLRTIEWLKKNDIEKIRVK